MVEKPRTNRPENCKAAIKVTYRKERPGIRDASVTQIFSCGDCNIPIARFDASGPEAQQEINPVVVDFFQDRCLKALQDNPSEAPKL